MDNPIETGLKSKFKNVAVGNHVVALVTRDIMVDDIVLKPGVYICTRTPQGWDMEFFLDIAAKGILELPMKQ